MAQKYHCPHCSQEIGFGESICPSCKADVTSVWEQVASPKNTGPKVIPGMGMADQAAASPFPPPSQSAGSPFPPLRGESRSPFPPPQAPASSPFPPPVGISPFPPASSPFPPPQSTAVPFPPASSAPPLSKEPYLEIPRIGAKIPIPSKDPDFRIGRDEIQAAATSALPDLNAYRNISRKRPNSEHFIIHCQNGKYTIEDIHSTNGTYLGATKLGQGVAPQPLKDGDKIIIPIEELGKMVQLEILFRM